MSGVDATSKYSHRLVRDIILSNDIGRPASVDPSSSRDITKLFGDPKNVVRGLQQHCFAEKPVRHRAPSPVDLQRTTGRNKGPDWTKNPNLCDGDYHLPPAGDVNGGQSFTKGWRWRDDVPRSAAQNRKDIQEKQRTMRLDCDISRRAAKREAAGLTSPHGTGSKKESEGASSSDDAMPLNGMNFSNGAASWFSRHTGRDKSTGTPSKGGERFGHLPWTPHPRTTAVQQGGVVLRPQLNNSPDLTEQNARPPLPSGRQHSTSQQQQDNSEQQLPSSSFLLNSSALADGKKAPTTKRAASGAKRGADFTRLASRKAPLFFGVPPPETHDLMYLPSYEPTTKFRANSANVRLARYSGREDTKSAAPLLANAVGNLLDFSNLVKFQAQQRQKAKDSIFALPVHDDDDEDPLQPGGGGGGAAREAELPLAKEYDLDIHPESVIMPKMTPNGRVQGVPWLSLYAPREGTSVVQAVGRTPGSALRRPASRLNSAEQGKEGR